jgi:alpha-tubulin suppressor-like RCC1 family protein
VGTASDWKTVTAGDRFTLAIKADGSLWAWGRDGGGSGTLGLGDLGGPATGEDPYRAAPVRVGTANDWKAVSAGVNHTLALKTDGRLWAWGSNMDYQLGNSTAQGVPAVVGTDDDWADVQAGQRFTLAIKADGALRVWGSNTFGQLGVGSTTDRTYANNVRVGTDDDWAAAAASEGYSMAFKMDGTLWSWGRNNYGQLGIRTFTQQTAPSQVTFPQ